MEYNEHPIKSHLKVVDGSLTRISKRTRLSKGQLVLLSIFPLVIVVGQLMGAFSPEETTDNYLTSRGNIVNTVFVKKGWFWTLLTYANMVYNKFRKRLVNKRVVLVSMLRVAVITLGWFLFTQWFFGPPLMDKIFVLTGGRCSGVHETNIPDRIRALFTLSAQDPAGDYFSSGAVSSATCKAMRGSWEGGHDPSGHIFLLTLSICVLVLESIELYTADDDLIDHVVKSEYSWKQIATHPAMLTGMVVLGALNMFLMTIIKYHSLWEQCAGFLVAVLVIVLSNRIIEVLAS